MKKKIIYLSLIIVFILGVYFIFFNKKDEKPIQSVSVSRADISQSIQAVGEVYAKEQVNVGAQVSGQIKELPAKVGQRVKMGELLAQIDKDKQQNNFEITKAQLASAKANLESKKVALDIAAKQYSREQKLYQVQATSLESLETLKNNFYTLKANVAELNARVVQLEIELKNTQKDLEYTTISAPSDGIIVNVAVELGQTVNANQNTPTIVQIANLDEMEIRMEIAEADISKIKIGDIVKYSLLSDPDTKFEAKIASIDPADTSTSNATSTSSMSSSSSSTKGAVYYYAKFYVKNENNFLRIGMSLENEIIIKSVKNALVLPTYAIKNDNKGYFVNVLENEESVKKYIKLGIKDSINTEIIDGLNEGEKVVISLDGGAFKPKFKF